MIYFAIIWMGIACVCIDYLIGRVRATDRRVTQEELMHILHSCGLDAYNNYKDKGYARDKWDEFRSQIAGELIKRLDIIERR